MHHITPFWDEKFINFLGRGTASPHTLPPRRLRRLDSRVFGARPSTPNVPVALTPMRTSLCLASYVSCQRVRLLLAFAAKRRAAAPLLLSAGCAAIDRYHLPAERTAANSQRMMEQTDKRTDRQTNARRLHRTCTAYYVSSVNKLPGHRHRKRYT